MLLSIMNDEYCKWEVTHEQWAMSGEQYHVSIKSNSRRFPIGVEVTWQMWHNNLLFPILGNNQLQCLQMVGAYYHVKLEKFSHVLILIIIIQKNYMCNQICFQI